MHRLYTISVPNQLCVGVAIPDHFSIPGFRDKRQSRDPGIQSNPGIETVCKSGLIVEIRGRLHQLLSLDRCTLSVS